MQYTKAILLMLISGAIGVDNSNGIEHHHMVRGYIGGVDDGVSRKLLQTPSDDDYVSVQSRYKNSNMCLTATSEGNMVTLKVCDSSKSTQQWFIDGSQWRPRSDLKLCIAMELRMKECKENSEKQSWNYDNGKEWIRNKSSGLCMNAKDSDSDFLGGCAYDDDGADEELTWKLIRVMDDKGGDDGDSGDDDSLCSVEGEKAVDCGVNAKPGRGQSCCGDLKCGGEKNRYCVKPDKEDEDEGADKCSGQTTKTKCRQMVTSTGCFWSKAKGCIDATKCSKIKKNEKACLGATEYDCAYFMKKENTYICNDNTLAKGCSVARDKTACTYNGCTWDSGKCKEPDDGGDDPEPESDGALKDCSWQKLTAFDGGKGKKFGFHAVIDLDTLVAVDFDHPLEDVYVFKRTGDGKWKFHSKLDTDDRKAGDNFQYVAISGNGNYIGVSAKSADTNGMKDSGTVFVFKYDKDDKYKQVAYLLGSDVKAGDLFGNIIAMDGATLLAGARLQNNERGAVYAFRNMNGNWKQYGDKLLPSDVSKGDQFGRRINFHGGTAVISALYADDFGTNAGVPYVFEDKHGVGFKEIQKLVPTDKAKFKTYGFKVDIYGGTIVVGAEDTNGNGAVYVFTRNDDRNWSQAAKLTPEEEENDYLFGTDVAIHRDTILVNALSEQGSGLVYVFQGEGSQWKQQLKLSLENSKPSREDGFGDSLAIDGVNPRTAVLGAPRDDDGKGSVYAVDLCR